MGARAARRARARAAGARAAGARAAAAALLAGALALGAALGAARGARAGGGEGGGPYGEDGAQCEAVDHGGGAEEGGVFIVRFDEYAMQDEHRSALGAALCGAADRDCGAGGADGDWEWVPRDNAAAAHPTDFGLVRLRGPQLGARSARARLAALPFVRGVHADRRIRRSAAAAAAGADAAERLLAGGGRTLLQHGEGAAVENPELEVDAGLEADLEADLEGGLAHKRPGRRLTRWSMEPHEDGHDGAAGAMGAADGAVGRRLLAGRSGASLTGAVGASALWERGFSGQGVRTGVFDTGVRADHPHLRKIKERTNWTHEPTLNDGLGHGTFVAGVIAGQDDQCHGFAPDAEIYTFRVFTNDQVSYTSWFLDAFNYAIATEINIVNLSIGGPDYLDVPFVEKVSEVTANGIIMVSAIGNDGPLYGTLNNPADMMDVIGVGGIDYSDHIASFSSRGVTTEELPHGAGRLKPDIVTYGRDVSGSKIQGGCRSLSGTSVASPVVAGAITLLASTVPEAYRWDILNPASMKQAIVHTATKLRGPPMTEQGAGKINIVGAAAYLAEYTPRATIHPAMLDTTSTSCPQTSYFWPHCKRALYATGMPAVYNVTVLNGMGLTGVVAGEPRFVPKDSASRDVIDVDFTFSDVLWPWTGYLGMHVSVRDDKGNFRGTVEGTVEVTIVSPPLRGSSTKKVSVASMELKLAVIPTPPREKRVLWDLFHNIPYPPGYVPRDNIDARGDVLDWHGDHPYTNYHGAYVALVDAGFHVEFLGSSFMCFDASNYGSLLLADAEEEYTHEEVAKLASDVKEKGLGLVVFADWYQTETMTKMKFFDDNTRSWWTPITGGANVPALNDLLEPHGIALGSGAITNGKVTVGSTSAPVTSGTDIVRFPKGGYTFSSSGSSATRKSAGGSGAGIVAGLTDSGAGRVGVFGDANCIDLSHAKGECNAFLKAMIGYVTRASDDLVAGASALSADMGSMSSNTVSRTDADFAPFSKTLGKPEGALCGMDAPRGLRSFDPPRNAALGSRVVGDLSGVDLVSEAARYKDEILGRMASARAGSSSGDAAATSGSGVGAAAGLSGASSSMTTAADGAAPGTTGAAGAADASGDVASGRGGASMVDIARAAASVGGGDERVTGDGPRPVVGIAGGAGSQSQGPLVGLHAGGISQLQALQIGGGVVVVLLYMAARNRKKLKVGGGRRRVARLS